MATPLSLITLALKDIEVLGVGQTAKSEDTNDAFTTLNQMIAEWNRKRWLVFRLVSTGFTSTGATSYTVGPGGNYNLSPRPARLESAFLRQLIQSPPNQVDIPLELIQSREEYDRIRLKQLTSIPAYVFYDPGFPTGTLYPWPVPQTTIYQVFITTMAVLAAFATLTETVSLPAEYEAAIRYNLGARLLAQYGVPDKPAVLRQAKLSLNTLRQANAAITPLLMPAELYRPGIYNVYADRYY